MALTGVIGLPSGKYLMRCRTLPKLLWITRMASGDAA
jgi:hypothetical protein